MGERHRDEDRCTQHRRIGWAHADVGENADGILRTMRTEKRKDDLPGLRWWCEKTVACRDYPIPMPG